MAGSCCGSVRVLPRLDPAACNALRQTASGLLVPRAVLEGIAPGGTVGDARSVDIDVTDTGGQDCPDTWQIGARLSPVSGSAALPASFNLLSVPRGTVTDVGLTITLPEVGRYHLAWNAQGQICATANPSSNLWIDVDVFDSSTGASLGQPRSIVQHQFSGATDMQACVVATAPIDHLVTVTTAPRTLTLRAVLQGPTGALSSATIAGGRTAVTMHKISD